MNDCVQWKLNLDILLYLMFNFLDTSDFWAVMHSCYVLYATAVSRYIYQQGTIEIYDQDHLSSFWRFLSARGRTGYLALQGFRFLDILDLWSDDQIHYLRNILKRSVNLKELVLRTGVLASDDDYAVSIAALGNLEVLDLYGSYNDVCAVTLKSMRSPIVKIDMSFGYRDPIPLLANFQTSLGEINCSYVKFRDTADIDEYIYPRVFFLNIDNCKEPLASALIPAFPNLKWLIIENDVEEIIDVGDPIRRSRLARERSTLRKRNEEFQELQSWDTLDFLSIDLARLYLLAPRYKAAHLCLSGPLYSNDNDIDIFTSSLAHIRPMRLNFSLRTRDFPIERLVEILSTGVEELKRLDIYLEIESPDTYPEEALVTICTF